MTAPARLTAEQIEEIVERFGYYQFVRELMHHISALDADLAALKAERDAWIDSARQFSRNEDYYRGLVVTIGKALGREAYTSDDGSIQQDVLCAKVPDLVRAILFSEPPP